MQQRLLHEACRAPVHQTKPRQRHTYPRSNNGRCLCPQYYAFKSQRRLLGSHACSSAGRQHNSVISCLPVYFLINPGSAVAEDLASYNAGSQSEFLQNLAGVVYVGLVAYLLYKVFTRRAKRFTSEVRPHSQTFCLLVHAAAWLFVFVLTTQNVLAPENHQRRGSIEARGARS